MTALRFELWNETTAISTMGNISLHDLVAIKESIKTQRFPFGGDILLPKGLVGTVVIEHAEGEAFEVEFSDRDGQAYAMLPIEEEKLFLIYFDFPEFDDVSLAAAS